MTDHLHTVTQDKPGVYHQVLGQDIERVGPPLRQFLQFMGKVCGAGTFDVRRRDGVIGVLLSAFWGFPETGKDVPLQLIVERSTNEETWIRDFAGRKLTSIHSMHKSLLVEKVGVVRIYHQLTIDDGALVHRAVQTCLAGIRLPRIISPVISARGTPIGRGWDVSVEIAFPLIGPVLQYSGHVEVVI